MPRLSASLRSRKMRGICPASCGPDAWDGEAGWIEAIAVLDGKVVGGNVAP